MCDSEGEIDASQVDNIIIDSDGIHSGCSKIEFDGFDPTTSAVRWIMKGGDNE